MADILGGRWAAGEDSGIVAREVTGQLAVRGLGEEVLCLLFEGYDCVGAGGEAQRRLVLACELEQDLGKLGALGAHDGQDSAVTVSGRGRVARKSLATSTTPPDA
jgi:hypothetical protein